MRRKTPIAINEYYHLYNRGVDKRDIFLEEADYERFLVLMHLSNREERVNLHEYFAAGKRLNDAYSDPPSKKIVAIGAYCLMPNHFHFLCKEIVEGGTALFMKKLCTGYAMYFNAKNQRSGALFQGRYKSQHVDNDVYLKYMYSYIHLNPAKLVDSGWGELRITDRKSTKKFIEEFPYSSYRVMKEKHNSRKSLLSSESFPEHFTKTRDFDEMISIWENKKDRPF